jgi:hypothetical protein
MRLALLLVLGFGAAFLLVQNAVAQTENIEVRGKNPVEARVSYQTHSGRDEDVHVRVQVSGEEAGIRVTGCPHNNFQLTIEVPRSSNLYVRMFAGEMNVNGITGDKDVELHAGELNMELGKPEDYAHVDASVLTGDLEASAFDVSKGGLFRSFDRSGPGKYRVHAHVGAGQIELR